MQHVELAQGRWQTLTLAEQLGNIGSEFDRVLAAKKAGDKDRADKALARFLELFDLTLADGRWASARRRELARLREQSLEEFEKGSALESLSQYYLNFALAARKNR